MSEIRKIGKERKQTQQPQIIGANPMNNPGPTKTLDQRTRTQPAEIQTTEHEEVVTVSSHTRSKPRKKDEPEVRLRVTTPESKAKWESVKKMEWEDE